MPPSTPPDIALLEYATEAQARAVKAWHDHGTSSKAAASLGISTRNIFDIVARLKKVAALRGYSPDHDMDKPTAPGFNIKGTSTLYGPKGEVKQQWVKTDRDKEAQLEAMQAAMDDVATRYKNAIGPIEAPRTEQLDHLCALYPLGDPHIGMYACRAESGADFNLAIAKQNLEAAVDKLAYLAPNAHHAVICDVGDSLHVDNQTNATPRGGNQLDAAGRYHEILEAAIDAKIRLIIRAAQTHQKVTVYQCAGNHDPMSTLWLRQVLKYAFAGSSRIKINTEPRAFHYHRFGKNLWMFTHGDGPKPQQLGEIMATDVPKLWGQTLHRVAHTGHVHHQQVKDQTGWRFESHRTLAAQDGWHRGKGYRAERSMQCIIYHREHGEALRHTVGVGQL